MNTPMHSILIINTTANQGTAQKRWNSIKEQVLAQFPEKTPLLEYAPPFDLKTAIQEHVEKGINTFIIGGGDGTKTFVLNVLIDLYGEDLSRFALGGLALGSSNDFHKPYEHYIDKIPVKIKQESPLLADIGKVVYKDPTSGNNKSVYFIINSSIGVLAEANHFFNSGDFMLRFLKPISVGLAIPYTGVRTILAYKNKKIKMEEPGQAPIEIKMSNLSLVKNPHISGDYYYDQDIKMDDGQFGLNYCEDMTKMEMIKTLLDLEKGKFTGKPKRVSKFVNGLKISAEEPLALETDGEVCLTNEMEFSILPKAIQLLS